MRHAKSRTRFGVEMGLYQSAKIGETKIAEKFDIGQACFWGLAIISKRFLAVAKASQHQDSLFPIESLHFYKNPRCILVRQLVKPRKRNVMFLSRLC
jgi:hypothetical protein